MAGGNWLACTFFKDLEARTEAQLEVGRVFQGHHPKASNVYGIMCTFVWRMDGGWVASLARSPLQFSYLSR